MGLQSALRCLRQDDSSLTAVIVLALGIGSATAVFTVVDSVLLRPIAYRHPERLMAVEETIPQFAKFAAVLPVNSRHYFEWKAQMKSFEDIGLADLVDFNLTGEGEAERLTGARVTANFFSVLGVEPQFGHDFHADDAQEGRDRIVLLSDALWRRRFAADPHIVGKTIELNGLQFQVAGVLPESFRQYAHAALSEKSNPPELFRPWTLKPEDSSWVGNHNYAGVARLRPGVTREQALAELNVVQASIVPRFPAEVGKMDLFGVLTPLQDRVVERGRAGLLLLLGAVGAVLLISCVNLGNLMLARAIRRGRETAIRIALGAGKAQIAGQVLMESLIVATAGGALGLAVALGLLKLFTVWAPVDLPRADEVHMDARVLLFTVAISALAALLFGLAPALRLASSDPQKALRSGGRSQTEGGSRMRLREVLVGVETGLSAALLILAGLLGVSFLNLGAVPRGFVSSNVLTAQVALPGTRYKTVEDRRRFYTDLLARLQATPGVTAAGVISVLPLQGQGWADLLRIEGDTRPEAQLPVLGYRPVSPKYFEAMGIPITRGRAPSDRDYPQKPVIVSRKAAELAWHGQDPVGQHFFRDSPKEKPFQVVGISGDVHSQGLEKDAEAIIYVPLWERAPETGSIALRSQGDPAAAAGVLRDAVRAVDAQVPLSALQTMKQIEDRSLGERSFETTIALVFALSALLLALIGTYSVIAYSVGARTNEIGIRMALGAQQGGVVRLILTEGLRPVLIGSILGTVVAAFAARAIESMLFAVKPGEPSVYAAVVLTMLAAAVFACVVPAWRGSRISPLEALRYE